MVGNALVVALAAIAGCEERPATQALVVFDAEEPVRSDAARLVIHVEGPDGEPVDRDIDLRSVDPLARLPITLPLVPRGGDASRTFELVAHLYDDTGAVIGEQRAQGGYRPNVLVTMEVLFPALCREIACPGARTCVAGYCVDACHHVDAAQPSGPGPCFSPCTLTPSSPITVDADGTELSNLRIEAPPGEPAIVIEGRSRVTLRNLEIVHDGADAIVIADSSDVVIEGVAVTHVPRAVAPEIAAAAAVRCRVSTGLTIDRLRIVGSSGGVVASGCSSLSLSRISATNLLTDDSGYAGALLESNGTSSDIRLEDYSVVNDLSVSYVHHHVAIFDGTGVTVRRGLMDGSDAFNGSSMKLVNTADVVIDDVDSTRSGHIAFEGFPAMNATLTRTRVRDTLCEFRDGSPSGGIGWYFSNGSSDVEILDGRYDALCSLMGGSGIVTFDAAEEPGLVLRDPLPVPQCFDPGGSE